MNDVMPTYVRVTFLPYGADRRRTTWAVKVREYGDRVTYLACDKYGETERDMGVDKNGTPIERKELILCFKVEVDERPARMSLKYAELELTSS
jgi:hypothetical protein